MYEQHQRELDDINRNGVKSEYFEKGKDQLEIEGDYSYEDSKAVSDKEWLKRVKDRYGEMIDYYADEKKKNDVRIESINNTALNKKTYLDKTRRADNAGAAVWIAGTAGGIATSVALKKKGYISKGSDVVKIAAGLSFASFLAGGFASFNSSAGSYDPGRKI